MQQLLERDSKTGPVEEFILPALSHSNPEVRSIPPIGRGRRVALLAVHHVQVDGQTLTGGAEKYIQQAIEALLRVGTRVHVGYSGDSIYDQLLAAHGPNELTVERTGWLDENLSGDARLDLGVLRRRRRWLKAVHADTVFAVQQASGGAFVNSLVAAILLRLRVVTSIRVPYCYTDEYGQMYMDYVLIGFEGGGAYYTRDGGRHWRRSIGIPDEAFGFRLAVDKARPNVVYAATGSGLYRSADGGVHFTNVKLPTGECAGKSNRVRPCTRSCGQSCRITNPAGRKNGCWRDANPLCHRQSWLGWCAASVGNARHRPSRSRSSCSSPSSSRSTRSSPVSSASRSSPSASSPSGSPRTSSIRRCSRGQDRR